MYWILGKIRGLAPFLYNRMTEASLDSLSTGKSGGTMTLGQRLDEAKTKVYRDDSGLIIPAWTFKRMLLDGCAGSKLKMAGRMPAWKAVYASVFVDGALSFGKDEPDFIHEAVGKIPPRTGKAAILRRPALSEGWELPFKLTVLEAGLPPEVIKVGLEYAGLRVGLGAWRPEYGRFLLVDWKTTESVSSVSTTVKAKRR